MARALFATLCGLLATIFTVSSVGQIPYLYWILAGLCVAQTRIIRAHIAAAAPCGSGHNSFGKAIPCTA